MIKIHNNKKRLVFRNWKISSQILLFSMSIMLVLLIFAGLIPIYYFKILADYKKEESVAILKHQNLDKAKMYNRFESHSYKMFFHLQQSQLSNLDRFFQFIQSKNVQTIEPYECLNQKQANDNYATQSFFCYTFQEARNESKQPEELLKFTSMISQYLPELMFTDWIQYTSVNKEQFFAIYNFSDVLQTYRPHSRPWYNNHIKNQQHTGIIMSDPYFTQCQLIQVGLTHNLSRVDGKLLGVFAQDVSYSPMPKFDVALKFQLVNMHDTLIVSEKYQYNVSTILKIYDTNITGFTQEYWDYLKNQTEIHGEIIEEWQNENNTLISVIKQENPPSYIVLETQNRFLLEIDQLLVEYQRQRGEIIKQSTYSLLAIIGVSLLIQYLFMRYLQNDIRELLKMTSLACFNQNYRIYPNCRIIKKLNQSIQNIFNRKSKKSLFFKSLERIKYPYTDFRDIIMEKHRKIIDSVEQVENLARYRVRKFNLMTFRF